MSTNSRPNTLMMALAAAAASMGSLQLQAEVVPRPAGLGDWMARNNRHRFPKGPKPVIQRPKRLQRATGAGSYDEWKDQLAAARAAKRSPPSANEQRSGE